MKQRLKLLTFLCYAFLPLLASAYNFMVDGLCYDRNSDGTSVRVTYQTSSSPRYANLSGDLVIPETVTYNGTTYSVTSIGYSAFEGCSGLTGELVIPNSVTSIGDNAFSWCRGLTSVTIGNSVTFIGDKAFYDCSGLTSLTIGNSVTSIGNYAFYGCSGLTSVVWNAKNCSGFSYDDTKFSSSITNFIFGDSVQRIPSYLCNGMTKLTNIDIPNSVTSIGSGAFVDCRSLTSVTIPNSVTSIDFHTFYGCSGLTSVTIPNSVTSIGSGAFEDCRGLTSVTIPNSVTSIGGEAFRDCSGLTSVTIPNSVTFIGSSAFAGTPWYNNQPDGLVYAGLVAYKYKGTMPSGTSMEIREGTKSIADYCFYNRSGLTSVTIPSSLTSIDYYAFSGCNGLASVAWNAKNCDDFDLSYNPFSSAKASITNFIFGDSVQHIPSGLCGGMTKITSISIGNSVTSIGSGAFDGCSGLTSVTIGNSVTFIGDMAFYGCSGLTGELVIPNSVTSIEDNAFAYCSGLTSVTIGNSVTFIGDRAFEDCRGLTSVTIGNSVTSIGSSAFSGCSGLTSVTIPNSVTSIGNYAFEYCSGLTSVTIPNSVTSIGSEAFAGTPWYNNQPVGLIYAGLVAYRYKGTMPCGTSIEIKEGTKSIAVYCFYNCSGLTSVTIPNSVTSIGSLAFEGCSGLTSVTIPNSVTSIGYKAFRGCSGLTSVTIGNSVTSIDDNAFSGCSGLTSVTIPNSVTTIGGYAFFGCSGLTSVTIPNSVTSIGSSAFSGCRGLTSVTIGNSVTSIGSSAFSSCIGLTSVTIPNSVTSIGGSAFDGCSGLTQVVWNAKNCSDFTSSSNPFSSVRESITNFTFGDSVQKIPAYICYDFTALTSATIGNSVTSIGDQAFSWCSGLKTIYTEIENPQNVSYGLWVFGGVPSSCTIYVPMFTSSIYRQTAPWSAFCIVSDEANLVCPNASFSHTRGSESEVLDLPLELKNYVGVTGLQFDVTLPNYTSLQTALLEASRIGDDHSIDLQQLNSYKYRILVTSPTNKAFKEGEGVLVHLGIKVPQLHDTGNKVVKFSNLILVADDEQYYKINALDARLKLDYIVGDANADALVDAADYVVTARRIMGYSTATYYSDAANVNEDNAVNVTDLVGITNIALGIRPIERRQLSALMPNEQSAVHTAPALSATVQAQPDGNQVLLSLDNEWAAAGMQMDVTLPAGVTVLKAELLGRAARQQVDLAALADGRVRVLVSSFSASDIAAGGDAILALTLDGSQNGMMTVGDIVVAERDLTTHELAPLSVALSTTGVSDLVASAGVRIWAENGSVVIESDEAGMAQLVMLNGMTQPLQVQPGRNTYPVAPGYYIVRLAGVTAKLRVE